MDLGEFKVNNSNSFAKYASQLRVRLSIHLFTQIPQFHLQGLFPIGCRSFYATSGHHSRTGRFSFAPVFGLHLGSCPAQALDLPISMSPKRMVVEVVGSHLDRGEGSVVVGE